MIRPRSDGLGRGGNAFLVAFRRAPRAHAGGNDEPAFGLGQGTDQRCFPWRGDDAVGAGLEGTGGPFDDEIADLALADQRIIEIGAIERGEQGDGEDPRRRPAPTFHGGAHDMGVSMDGEEVMAEAGETAHGAFYGGADVEQLEIEEDALAVRILELVRQRQTAAREHAEADLVETDRLAELFRHFESGHGMGQIERHDQPVVRVDRRSGHAGRGMGGGILGHGLLRAGAAVLLHLP